MGAVSSPVSSASPTPPAGRHLITLAYDGSGFHGWARQPGRPSVQEALEDALATILREPVGTVVAGRTDAGVHARRQVVHVDLGDAAVQRLRGRDGKHDVPATLVRRLNAVLARSTDGAVLIHAARRVPEGFDARFSALWRSYTYTIADGPQRWDPLRRTATLQLPDPLDVAAMDAEARTLLGLHDFLSFCKPRAGATTIRELQAVEVRRGEVDGLVRIRLRADAFCHHMVRTIVGALVSVGSARRPSGWAGARLQARVRDADTRMVAGHALVLDEVGYPDDEEAVFRAQATRARRDLEG